MANCEAKKPREKPVLFYWNSDSSLQSDIICCVWILP